MKKFILLTALALALALAVVFVGPEVAMTFKPPTSTVTADCGNGSC
jgi:hypothetical protein